MLKMLWFDLLRLVARVEHLNLLEHMVALFLCQVALFSLIKLIELLNQEIVPIFHKVLNLFLEAELVVRVKYGKQQVHEQKETKDQESNKEYAIELIELVCR